MQKILLSFEARSRLTEISIDPSGVEQFLALWQAKGTKGRKNIWLQYRKISRRSSDIYGEPWHTKLHSTRTKYVHMYAFCRRATECNPQQKYGANGKAILINDALYARNFLTSKEVVIYNTYSIMKLVIR